MLGGCYLVFVIGVMNEERFYDMLYVGFLILLGDCCCGWFDGLCCDWCDVFVIGVFVIYCV